MTSGAAGAEEEEEEVKQAEKKPCRQYDKEEGQTMKWSKGRLING